MTNKTIVTKLIAVFVDSQFTLKQAYTANKDSNETSVRARIYENLGTTFERIERGVYAVSDDAAKIFLLEGDGRDLSFIDDNSIDLILTDHPYSFDKKSLKGGNRNFADYEGFQYTMQDFVEKYRVLKPGHFLVEFLPEFNAENFDYVTKVIKFATQVGFQIYTEVDWKKGNFVSNTGRKAKNKEQIWMFSKGKAVSMRADKKKDLAEPGKRHYMSGTSGMLPTAFDVQPPGRLERIHQSEKPVELISEILAYVLPKSRFDMPVVLDQFAGSGSTGISAALSGYLAIMIEKSHEHCEKIINRFESQNIEIFSVLKSKVANEFCDDEIYLF